MMKHTIKRSLSLLICMAVLCTFLPMAVFAAETDAGKILNDAYALASGGKLDYEATLTGKVITVDEVYSSQYKNITVTIEVPGYEDKPVKCYRMTGNGVDEVDIGYTITVTGNITKYYETVEFANNKNQGMKCELVAIVKRGEQAPEDPKLIVDAAFALAPNATLPYTATLIGKVTEIVDPYSEQYGNITVNIAVESSSGMKTIECYRMKGDTASTLAVGDMIEVTGILKHYYKAATDEKPELSKIEFDAKCTFVPYVVAPSNPKQIVDEAFALEQNAALPYTATLTGKVTEIVTPYSEEYNNITVNMEVEGSTGKKTIECFRLSGEGADQIVVGNTIKVEGTIKRYYKAPTDEYPEAVDKIEFDCPKLISRQASSNNGSNTTSNTGLVKQNGTWYYVENGIISVNTTALVKWNNSWWYVVKGKLASTTTGLVKWNGAWWYIVNGKVASNTTTLIKYNNEWWYVVNGKVASNTTSLVKYNNEWWYVVKGKIASNTTSLVKYNNEWWYVVKGKIASNTTSLVKYNNEWWYVVKGKIAAKTTTLVNYSGSWYYVVKGKIASNTTTLVKYNGTWYYVYKGVLNRSYNGKFVFNGKAYQIKNGQVV